MKAMLSKSALEIFDGFCLSNTLFAFDYDGTLSRIVDDPDKANLESRTRDLLSQLNQCAPVAVLSGRGRADVQKLLGLNLAYVVGNHGLEGLETTNITYREAENNCANWLGVLKVKLGVLKGIVIEDKKYSLAIHFRNSRTKKSDCEKIENCIAGLTPKPRVILGKYVFNLVTENAPHKGRALLELMQAVGCQSAVYFGDDDTDEDVFALNHNSILTVRVGRKVKSEAQFYIAKQSQMNSILSRIVKLRKKTKDA